MLPGINNSSVGSIENPLNLTDNLKVAGQVSFANQISNAGTAHHPIVNNGLNVPQTSMSTMNFNNCAATNIPLSQPSTTSDLSKK